ncbi:hypothetical protein DPMN_038823 [Dreissena polymorpha]|uniref:Uncharacterized protein n=1 Tax=Dreissena polymorpha TaxID=45954 RepID=A0A9D4MDV5_DREPO|nr:hypothetical protein DPMN_038823 [Dreissena polymorpha]
MISKNSDKGFFRPKNTSPHIRRRFSVKQSSAVDGNIKPDLEKAFGKLQFVVHPNNLKTVRITINVIQIYADTDDSKEEYYYYIKVYVDNGKSSATTRKKKMAADGYVSFRETVKCPLSIVDFDDMGGISFFLFKKKHWSPFETAKCVAKKKVYFKLNSDCLLAEVDLYLH